MKKYSFVFILLMSTVAFSQNHYEDSLKSKLDHSIGSERIMLLYNLGHYYMERDSTKAFQYINRGLELANKENDKRKQISGKIAMAKLHIHYNDPHIAIENILQLSHLFSPLTYQDSLEVADILSTSLRQLGAVKMAIDYRKTHCRLVARKNKLSGYYYSSENIAYLYSQIQQYDSANYYYDQAYQIAQNMHKISLLMHCNNNMGYNYYVQGLYEQALDKYNLAVALFMDKDAPTISDSLLYAIIIGNIGNVYVKQNLYEKAAEQLDKATSILKLVNSQGIADSLHYGSYLIEYAEVEVFRNRFRSAEVKLLKSFNNIRNTPAELAKYYEILAIVYEKTGRRQLAINAMKNQQEVNKKIIEAKSHVGSNIHDLVQFQQNRIQQEIKLLNMLVESDKKVHSLRIQLIVGLSSLAIIILLVLFFRFRSEQRKKEKLLEIESNLTKLKLRNELLESNRLREELDYKNKDLSSFAIDITRKHDFIQEILARLNKLKAAENLSGLKEIIIYTKSQLQIDNNLKLFQENVNKVNHEFMAKLQQKYPDLTTNEQQICALLRLQLSTKEIATVKNISPDSVKVLRHRLRKKMNLASDISLNKFLDKLI